MWNRHWHRHRCNGRWHRCRLEVHLCDGRRWWHRRLWTLRLMRVGGVWSRHRDRHGHRCCHGELHRYGSEILKIAHTAPDFHAIMFVRRNHCPKYHAERNATNVVSCVNFFILRVFEVRGRSRSLGFTLLSVVNNLHEIWSCAQFRCVDI